MSALTETGFAMDEPALRGGIKASLITGLGRDGMKEGMKMKKNVLDSEEKSLVKLIKFRMTSLGWRAKVLSDKSGVKSSVISRLLNGSANIGVENIFKLLNTLELLNHGNSDVPDTIQEASMSGKDDMGICKKMGISVMDWHELLLKMERLDAREFNLVAMQLINRAVIKMEQP